MNTKYVLGAVAALALFGAAEAQAASATASASATVVAPIAISKNTDLAFGNVAPTGSAGTVTVSTAGARTNSNVDLLGGTPTAANFTVTGNGTATFAITLPSSATLTGTPSGTMTVSNFTHDAGGTPALVGGTKSFNVGAELAVGASQAAGSYTGTFNVVVAYN